jgi:signal peptidase II
MVVDFLDFYYGANHWPAFNVADSAITIGVALMILEIVTDRERG